jgi:hypothetical protein
MFCVIFSDDMGLSHVESVGYGTTGLSVENVCGRRGKSYCPKGRFMDDCSIYCRGDIIDFFGNEDKQAHVFQNMCACAWTFYGMFWNLFVEPVKCGRVFEGDGN